MGNCAGWRMIHPSPHQKQAQHAGNFPQEAPGARDIAAKPLQQLQRRPSLRGFGRWFGQGCRHAFQKRRMVRLCACQGQPVGMTQQQIGACRVQPRQARQVQVRPPRGAILRPAQKRGAPSAPPTAATLARPRPKGRVAAQQVLKARQVRSKRALRQGPSRSYSLARLHPPWPRDQCHPE